MSADQQSGQRGETFPSSGLSTLNRADFTSLSAWAEVVVFALVYMLTAILSLSAMHDGDSFNLYVPQGLALAMIILKGPRMLSGLFLGQFLASWIVTTDPLAATADAVAYSLANFAAFRILRTYQFDKRLRGAGDYFILLLVSVGTALLASSVAIGFVLLGQGLPAVMAERFVVFGFGDLMASVTVTPLLLLVYGRYDQPERITATARQKLLRLCLTVLVFQGLHLSSHLGGHLTESHLVDFGFMLAVLAVALHWGLRMALTGATLYLILLAYHPKVPGLQNIYYAVNSNLLYHPVFESALLSLFAIIAATTLALSLREKHFHLVRNLQTEDEKSQLQVVKKDMIRTFGHEIGTPLLALQQALDQICASRHGDLLPEHLDALGQIKRIKRTSTLLQNYYSLVCNQQRVVSSEPVTFNELTLRLQGLIAELDPMSRVQLNLDQRLRDGTFNFPVTTFLGMSEELIRNALDHSADPLETVFVNVDLVNGGLTQQVRISVVNTISKTRLEAVRELGEKLVIDRLGHPTVADMGVQGFGEDSEHHRDGHLGLGLAVATRLANLVQAHLTLRVLPDSSRVVARVSLPAKAVSGSPAKGAQAAVIHTHAPQQQLGEGAETSDSSQRQDSRINRVFIVDDSVINLKVAAVRLGKLDCPVEVFSDPEQAVVQIINRAQVGDVILMDLQMPVLSGFDATRIIRHALGQMPLTVLAYTASSELECAGQLTPAGLDGYISKLDSSEVLLQRVAACLGKGARDLPLPAKQAQVFVGV